jgi:serine/threonine protein kinase
LYQKGDLFDFIKQCQDNAKTLDKSNVAVKKMKYIYQMINAVKQIHDKGIIHRDIKPENFFIGEDDKLYLGDFGCATEEYDKIELCGTPLYIYFFLNYMIYTLYHNNNKKEESKFLFKHCDLYSLMCVIFELNQHIPFQDEFEKSIFSEQQRENNINLNLLCPNINFEVPNNICNKIQHKYEECLKNIIIKKNLQENLLYCFSPLKKWENYKSNGNRKGNENCDNMLEEIIQNLFNTQFNIDSILRTKYYKALKACNSKKN